MDMQLLAHVTLNEGLILLVAYLLGVLSGAFGIYALRGFRDRL